MDNNKDICSVCVKNCSLCSCKINKKCLYTNIKVIFSLLLGYFGHELTDIDNTYTRISPQGARPSYTAQL